MNQDIIYEFCERYGTALDSAFMDAVSHYYDMHRNELQVIDPVAKANLINCYIFENLKQKLDGLDGITFIQKRSNQRFIGYQNKILIRIKKITSGRKPAVNNTKASVMFNTQQDIHFLLGRAENIYLGYVMSKDSGNIDTIAFLYPNQQGKIQWEINIEENRIQQKFNYIDYSKAIPDNAQTSRKARFKPIRKEKIL